ncbi:hypothetical protein [Sciscionella sediminilitoris]|uniref:hypothetical protein n=1 Tax=Sciscionella sediminilitoris TaxID=1445613 RepID=UPI0004DF5850|nr:hypothetical protein [Sciscionella sp. SE31]
MWWGLVCAALAAVLYGMASVLQAIAAQAGPEHAAPRALFRLLTHWRYLLGFALDGLGFLAQVLALRTLPLFLVQAMLAGSLAVTALGARWLMRTALARGEWLSVLAVGAGLALLGAGAAREGAAHTGTAFHLAVLIAAGGLAVPAWLSARLPARVRGPVLGLLAGFAFGAVAIASRVFDPAVWFADPAAYAIPVAGVVAVLAFAAALQRGRITVATAMMVLGETLLPSLIGFTALGDAARPGFLPLTALGFAVAVLAAIALARFGEPGPVHASPERD